MEETTSQIKSTEDLIKLADPFAQLMNQLQLNNGESVFDVVSAGLYALGCALAQIGSHIDIQAPITEAIPPLAIGYKESMDTIKTKMI